MLLRLNKIGRLRVTCCLAFTISETVSVIGREAFRVTAPGSLSTCPNV